MFPYFLKNCFNNYKFLFLFILISCSDFKEEYSQINIDTYECSISHQEIFSRDFITINDEYFDKSINVVNKIVSKSSKYNFIFSTGPKSSSGYNLNFLNSSLKNKNLYLVFKEKKPKKSTIVATVITYPFCALLIENIESYNISVEIT
tara:strand:- start:48 stop:491 length:444 start_codon:yes stop_codon:yes gene_type:complete